MRTRHDETLLTAADQAAARLRIYNLAYERELIIDEVSVFWIDPKNHDDIEGGLQWLGEKSKRIKELTDEMREIEAAHGLEGLLEGN